MNFVENNDEASSIFGVHSTVDRLPAASVLCDI